MSSSSLSSRPVPPNLNSSNRSLSQYSHPTPPNSPPGHPTSSTAVNAQPGGSGHINAVESQFTDIDSSEITEACYLLLPAALPKLEITSLDDVVLLRYPTSIQMKRDSAVDMDYIQPLSRSNTYDVKSKYKCLPLRDLPSTEWLNSLWVDSGDTINIMYVRSHEKSDVETVLHTSNDSNTSTSYNHVDNAITDPLDAGKPRLATGLRLRSKGKHLTFFLGMPYLGSVYPNAGPNADPDPDGWCLTLPQYRHIGSASGSKHCNIRVWQAWHIIFDDSRIALFKSPSSPYASSAPLFEYQDRQGAFHTLAQLLGNLFQHEDAALNEFKTDVEGVLESLFGVSDQQADAADKANAQSKEDLDNQLSYLSVILLVITDQIKFLKDFYRVMDSHRSNGSRHPTCNAVQLSFPREGGEQVRITIDTLEALIKERMEKKEALDQWQMELREIRRGINETQAGAHSSANLETSVQMKGILENQAVSIAQQGQRVTVFTYVTTVFLPLGFFSSYLGMNIDVWSGVNSHGKFWEIALPITLFLVALLFVFLIFDDEKIKRSFRPKSPKSKP